jgi:predicted transcriptional regulator
MSLFSPKQKILAELKIILAKNIHIKQRDAAKNLGISHDTLNKYLKEIEGLTFKLLRRNLIRGMDSSISIGKSN